MFHDMLAHLRILYGNAMASCALLLHEKQRRGTNREVTDAASVLDADDLDVRAVGYRRRECPHDDADRRKARVTAKNPGHLAGVFALALAVCTQ
jgi:hypothetical protein